MVMENLFPTCSVKLDKSNSCLSLRCKSQDKRFFQKKNSEFVFEKLVKNGTTITSFLHAKSYLTKAIQVCFYGVKLGRNNFLRTISDFLSKWLKVVQKKPVCNVLSQIYQGNLSLFLLYKSRDEQFSQKIR